MKRKKGVYKMALSFCMAVLLTLQSGPLHVAVYAQELTADSDTPAAGEVNGQEEPEVFGLEEMQEDQEEPEVSVSKESQAAQEEPEVSVSEESQAAQEEPVVSDTKELQAAQEEPEVSGPKAAQVGQEEPVASDTQVSEYDQPESVVNASETAVQAVSAASDKTDIFMAANLPFPLEVIQSGITIAPGETILGRLQFTLKSADLKVPVNGDDVDPTNADTSQYIQKGDWIELKKADYFSEVVLPTVTKTLMAQTESGTKTLGTVSFTPESIKITFNGDDSFFNGVGRDITFSFETTADSDITGIAYGDSQTIIIFGIAYQLKNPDVTPAYSITLASPGQVRWDNYSYRGIQPAQFVEGAITWQSTVSSADMFDSTIKLSLDGKQFYTETASYGIYVPGSFKVNGVEAVPDIDSNGNLIYTFPEGTGQSPEVEYKTWINKQKYYYEYQNPPTNLGRSYQVAFGKVKLLDGDGMTVEAEAGQEISFAADWIQTSGSLDFENQTITWTVNVNSKYSKKGLKNFTITDVLPSGLEFESAQWQTWVDGVASELKAIVPDENGVYSFGDIDGSVSLVIKSKIISGTSFKNEPRANWELDTQDADGNPLQNNDVITGSRPNAVTDEATITIGAHGMTKTGSASSGTDGKSYDYDIGAITWTVNVTPQYKDSNLAVYDLLRYDSSFDITKLDSNDSVSEEVLTKISQNLYGSTWQQYQADSFQSQSGLNLEVITLTQDGKPVADLLKITGYTDEPSSFTYRSLMTNPDDFAGQYSSGQPYRYNRAYLFSGNTSVIQADARVQVFSRMLNKEMLYASNPIKSDGQPDTNVTPNNVTSYLNNDSNETYTLAAYDQVTKTATFRLVVNIPGLKTEEMSGVNRTASDIKLVDTLPEGWEFIPYSDGKDYVLYEGLRNLNTYGTLINSVVKEIEPTDPKHVVSFTHSENVGTFEFTKLESPYVILVKARPTNAALENYLDEFVTDGTAKQVLYNKAELKIKWDGTEKILTEQRKVIVPVQALGKSVTKPSPGVLEWTVNYSPPFHMEEGVYLQDTLSAGMSLRYESEKLVLTAPSMAVYRAKLTSGGTLEQEGAALDLSDPNCEVQVEVAPGDDGTTVLKFKMNDPNQFYQFVYQTEVNPSTAKAGDKMGNEVQLMGDDNLKSVSAKSESTLDSADVAGSSSSNALLPLIKVDPDGIPLQNVVFTLYNKEDGSITASGTTGAEGKLNLLFPNPGYYELKETYIDTETWLPNTTIYQVYVGSTPGKPIWVDGVKADSDNPLIVPTPAQGKLTISNTVEGKDADVNMEFVFTVTFSGEGKDDSYSCTMPDGSSVKIKSGDKITIKDGEEAVLPVLPVGLTYIVTQQDYSAEDYTTDPTGLVYTGTIENKGDHKADFVNTRILLGSLLIGNTVKGNGADTEKEFAYTINLTGTGAGDDYVYKKSDGTTGTLKSGDTILLKNGETITAEGLPKDIAYTVTQDDYTEAGYVTDPENRSYTGIIAAKEVAEARFVNTKDLPSGLTLTADPLKVQGDGKTPSELTATLIDSYGNPVLGREIIFTLPDGSTEKATTDAQGKATISYIPPELTKTEAMDYSITARVNNPRLTEKDLEDEATVTAMPGAITGVIRDNTTGEVIPNAKVIVKDDKTGEDQIIRTDENGMYFLLVSHDGNYTVTFTQTIMVGGNPTEVTFMQKAKFESDALKGEATPADITAVGIILFKQPEGQTSMLNSEFAGKLHIYLKDASGNYILDKDGAAKAFAVETNGTFLAEGLSAGDYKMEVRYEFEPGRELTIIRDSDLIVKENGELNISQELVDPYGIITDKDTKAAIEDAQVTLYYADTQRNKDNGITPGTKVILPVIMGFSPNDNASPSQKSDTSGAYAYMVFPDTDYYLVVTKSGYVTYTSPIISVGSDIVRYDIELTKEDSSGGTNDDSETGSTTEPEDSTITDDNSETENSTVTDDNSKTESTFESGNDTVTDDNGETQDTSESGDNTGNGSKRLINVPKTGDGSIPLSYYVILAIMSSIILGICILKGKKKKYDNLQKSGVANAKAD